MKFSYSYQDRDGVRHEAEVDAVSQAEAYNALRKDGIRPMKVVPVEGEVAREARRKVGRRVTVIVVLLVALAVASVIGVRVGSSSTRLMETPHASVRLEPGSRIATPRSRRQIAFVPSEVVSAFAHPAERMLLRYVAPGRLPDEPLPEVEDALAEDLRISLDDPLVIRADDARTVVALKRMVAGLKEEARVALSDGSSAAEVFEYFEERQKMESAYRESLVERVRTDESSRTEVNATLRLAGLREIGREIEGKTDSKKSP